MKNVSEFIQENAKKFPKKTSISFESRSYSFLELDEKINQFCHKFKELGVKPQDKVLFFVKPNLDFAAITFALFRLGAITVFIDPGMKREYFLNAIEEVKPDVLVGIPKVHFLTKMKAHYFSNIRIFIQVGKVPFLAESLYKGLKKLPKTYEAYQPKAGELAAILYTSGGTGAPKGVEYTHDIFINQTNMLRETFSLTESDTDIPGFALFSFFSLAIGMRSHVPRIDVSKPSLVDPEALFADIKQSNASFLAGSPAIWDKLADYCLQNRLKLDSVKHVVMFGAPVDIKLHEKFAQILTEGTTYTPYGATECLPVACISGREILKFHKRDFLDGRGICVGKPIGGVEVKIIPMLDHPVLDMSQTHELSEGEIGEIVVHSQNVTQRYHGKPEATELAKISDQGKVWHRMGDVGFLDKDGKIWFCGRMKHVVFDGKEFFYPSQIEAIFNKHSKVKRSALVQNLETKQPVVIVQRKDNKPDLEPMLLMDLKNLAKTHEVTKKLSLFEARADLPVDVRHNIKIDRELLSKDVRA